MYKFFKNNNKQIFRFIVSGIIATSINFLVYNSIYLIFNEIIFASLCGYLIGILASFLLAKIWVFRDKSKERIIKSFFIFCLIYCLGGIEMSLIILFLNRLISDYKVAWLFGAFIGSLNNFLGAKFLFFKD